MPQHSQVQPGMSKYSHASNGYVCMYTVCTQVTSPGTPYDPYMQYLLDQLKTAGQGARNGYISLHVLMLLCSKGVFSDFSRRSLRNITSLVRFCTMADRLTLFQSIGLTRGKAQDTVKNEGLSKRLESVILQVGYSTLDRFHLLFFYVFPRPFCANSVQIFETNIRAPS